MRPVVSIIIPNYNHKPFLQQRLDTVFSQTYQDFEVILLDDASTDGSETLLNSYKNHPKVSHVIINKENSGSPFKQWEKGLKLAQGDFVWIAESDDYCELDFLEHMIGFMSRNTSIGLLYCQTTDVDKDGIMLQNRINYTSTFKPNLWKDDFSIEGLEFVSKYLSVKNVIPNASAVVFRKKYMQATIFSEDLLNMRMCGDWFFWTQLALNTNVGFLAKSMNYFRNHESISRNHLDLKTKKERLLEEGIIQYYIKKEGLNNHVAEIELYKKWFVLHSFFLIFNPAFYNIKFSETSTFSFLKHYFKFKF
ncbi:glycosyltransferase involved in cell wall biosynthesis [Winogradskyella wandonensis]|uniref:Glycosyltransferase involved in cell wall biosynthesis n=1 Tax=Winogradskyella wandonensis TaxID=1442586 RepID=A0A4R1KUD9_9FLAO|nr:glycosyltransferase family 2 protein [Winogradskyella wandonensis]TCK68818.1 glycosyltransferase involved in cell wall biosynthesis [Winogradskyella wandonensis]